MELFGLWPALRMPIPVNHLTGNLFGRVLSTTVNSSSGEREVRFALWRMFPAPLMALLRMERKDRGGL